MREFCYQHGLAEPSFYAWRRELAQRDQEQAAVGDSSGSLFLPLHVRAEPAAASSGIAVVEVVLGNGRIVRVPPGFDAATLRQVLAVLEAPPC